MHAQNARLIWVVRSSDDNSRDNFVSPERTLKNVRKHFYYVRVYCETRCIISTFCTVNYHLPCSFSGIFAGVFLSGAFGEQFFRAGLNVGGTCRR